MTTDNKDRLLEMISGMSDDEVQVLLERLESPAPLGNKREFARFSYSVSVDYVTPTQKGQATLRDLSIGGLFLEGNPSSSAFFVGQELMIRVPYPNKKKHVKLRGQIVRANREGVGIKFDKKRPPD